MTDDEGVAGWFSKSQDFAEHNSDDIYEDGFVTVVLRLDPPSKLIQDDVADDESFEGSNFISASNISPEGLEVWSGEEWLPVSDWTEIQPEDGLTSEDFDGDTIWYHDPQSKLSPVGSFKTNCRHLMSRKEWGTGPLLRTYRIGPARGMAGTFYGDQIKDWPGTRKKRHAALLPTEGDDVVILRGGSAGLSRSHGDAAGAPLGSRIWDGTLDAPLKSKIDAGPPHHKNIDRADAVAAIVLKSRGFNVVHVVDPKTFATVSVDLREHSLDDLSRSLSKLGPPYLGPS